MFRRLLTMLLALVTFLVVVGVYSSTVTTYTVNYAKNSRYKDLSLKNATLRIQLYAHRNPQGFLTKHTDGAQTFPLVNKYGTSLVLEVMSIKGEPKDTRCRGTVSNGKTEILINCQPRYSSRGNRRYKS